MHILNIALSNNVDLLNDYIALDEELDTMTYSDFNKIFSTCNKEVSELIYEYYISTDECHAAAIKYLDNLTMRRLVNIDFIPKVELENIIKSRLVVFSTYHLISDIPLEYIPLLTPDLVDRDELLFVLPLSSKDEIKTILELNPSLAILFGPYLSCTVSSPTNLSILREHERIIEVDYNKEQESLDLSSQETTPLELYLKTRSGKENINVEDEESIVLTSLEHIDLLHDLGEETYNQLEVYIDMDLVTLPDEYLKIINSFKGLHRSIPEVNLENAIRLFSYVDNLHVEMFINTSSESRLSEYNRIGLDKLWEKYHDNPTLIKLVLGSLDKDVYESLVPNIPQEYYRFL